MTLLFVLQVPQRPHGEPRPELLRVDPVDLLLVEHLLSEALRLRELHLRPAQLASGLDGRPHPGRRLSAVRFSGFL